MFGTAPLLAIATGRCRTPPWLPVPKLPSPHRIPIAHLGPLEQRSSVLWSLCFEPTLGQCWLQRVSEVATDAHLKPGERHVNEEAPSQARGSSGSSTHYPESCTGCLSSRGRKRLLFWAQNPFLPGSSGWTAAYHRKPNSLQVG